MTGGANDPCFANSNDAQMTSISGWNDSNQHELLCAVAVLTPLPIEPKSATLAAGTPDLAARSWSVARKNARDSDTFVVSGPDLYRSHSMSAGKPLTG